MLGWTHLFDLQKVLFRETEGSSITLKYFSKLFSLQIPFFSNFSNRVEEFQPLNPRFTDVVEGKGRKQEDRKCPEIAIQPHNREKWKIYKSSRAGQFFRINIWSNGVGGQITGGGWGSKSGPEEQNGPNNKMLLCDSIPERIGSEHLGGFDWYIIEEWAPDQVLELFEFHALMIF